MKMRQTWRWFGPADTVGIDGMLQAGVQGVVSALHDVPSGVLWQPEAIAERQRAIRTRACGSASGLEWEVVESLPVPDDLKRGGGEWRAQLTAWKGSLENLAGAGIGTVCYNFMPVLDWTRTDLAFRLPHGGTAMRFDAVDFAAFDLFLLERKRACEDTPADLRDAATERFAAMDEACRARLIDNVVCGLPGAADTLSLDDVRARLAEWRDIDDAALRASQIDFLGEVAPLAEALGMRLCCHPDDPPWPLLGLPRVMSTEADYASLLDAVDVTANGITLCSGSLGARADNDLPGMMRRLGSRVHFLHLRDVSREHDDDSCRLHGRDGASGSFHESAHLEGDGNMVELIAAVLEEEGRRRLAGRPDHAIPMRPDHGHDLLDDLGRRTQPGYPAIGRLRGLAELRGVEAGLSRSK